MWRSASGEQRAIGSASSDERVCKDSREYSRVFLSFSAKQHDLSAIERRQQRTGKRQPDDARELAARSTGGGARRRRRRRDLAPRLACTSQALVCGPDVEHLSVRATRVW